MNKLALIISLFIISSCASYIKQWHGQLDNDTKTYNNSRRKKSSKFDLYRKKKINKKFNISTKTHAHLRPATQRKYTTAQGSQRTKAQDLEDNVNTTSLWAGQGENSYLFTTSTRKKKYDIIIINVFSALKNDIQAELGRAFPVRRKKEDTTKKDQAKNKSPVDILPEPKQEEVNNNDVFDRISSVIVEEINKDHILLRGKKSILFRNRKRQIEIQALIARQDISLNNAVNSDKIIESSIEIMR
jgi:flagellar L-ring protein FlgH